MKRLTEFQDVCATAFVADGVRSATKYLSPKLIVKATRREPKSKRERSVSMVVTVGAPNYRERKFIRACRKAGEPFPVRNIQLRHWPAKKARARR